MYKRRFVRRRDFTSIIKNHVQHTEYKIITRRVTRPKRILNYRCDFHGTIVHVMEQKITRI